MSNQRSFDETDFSLTCLRVAPAPLPFCLKHSSLVTSFISMSLFPPLESICHFSKAGNTSGTIFFLITVSPFDIFSRTEKWNLPKQKKSTAVMTVVKQRHRCLRKKRPLTVDYLPAVSGNAGVFLRSGLFYIRLCEGWKKVRSELTEP